MTPTRHLAAGLLLFIGWAEASSSGAEIRGRVVGVTDGDTIKVLAAGKQTVVRLASIDAPEKGQPFGEASKKALSERLFNREVRIETASLDRYGRQLGFVFLRENPVNVWMVRQGWAWLYTQYSSDPVLMAAEVAARKERRGLWADKDPIPPWDWRKNRRSPPPGGVSTASPPPRARASQRAH